MKNRHLYPDDWNSRIRPAVLVAKNFRCEVCGVQNGKYYYMIDGQYIEARTQAERLEAKEWGYKVRRMGLQVIHKDQNPANNDISNLGLCCPRCHFRFDHASNALKKLSSPKK